VRSAAKPIVPGLRDPLGGTSAILRGDGSDVEPFCLPLSRLLAGPIRDGLVCAGRPALSPMEDMCPGLNRAVSACLSALLASRRLRSEPRRRAVRRSEDVEGEDGQRPERIRRIIISCTIELTPRTTTRPTHRENWLLTNTPSRRSTQHADAQHDPAQVLNCRQCSERYRRRSVSC